MTDAISEPNPADEDKRRIIEDATMAFRPVVIRDFPRDPPAAPGPALAALAAAATVRRLTKHRRLIDGFRRSTADVRAGLDGEARLVLESTLEPGLPDDRRQLLVDRAKRRLDEVAADPGEPRLQQRHWEHWVRSTDDIFRFTTQERTFAACNDEDHKWKLTPDGQSVWSRLIVAEFWSDLPPAAFREYVQPKNWPSCCQFWKSVDPLGPVVQTLDGYDWDFAETVYIITQTLTVPLHIGFRELPDHSRIWTRFNLSGPNYTPATQVDVDTGTISAESVSNGPAPTLVQATKWVHWRYNTQPDLTAQACDFGWCELMEEMAYGCAQGFTPSRLQALATQADAVMAPADAAKAPADAAVKQLVEAVTTEFEQVIGDNGPHLEQLIGRFTGKSWDAGWINDLLDMGLVTARHYGNIASDVRRFADSLRDAPAEADAPAVRGTPAERDTPAEGKVMAENDLVRLRPIDVARVWGTAFGQIVDLWRTSLTALMELGSGEQAISAGQSARFRVPSADGRMPRLTARNMIGEAFHQQLDGRLVVFTKISSDPGFVTVECSVDETLQPITGDTYVGQVVDGAGTVVAAISLDAGS